MILGTLIAALVGCTSIPEQIQGSYPDTTPARVDPGAYGSRVRWGGVIVDARNLEDSTCFEILSRELDKYLRPKVEDRSYGRYIACKPGFHDPEIYAKGREVTITGRIRSIEVRELDEFEYQYPVVDVDSLVLWEVREEVIVYHDYYDPFYYPYYWRGPYYGYFPFYRYPYPMSHEGRAYTHQLLPDAAEVEPRE
jgi:outer membrane lipoprotein